MPYFTWSQGNFNFIENKSVKSWMKNSYANRKSIKLALMQQVIDDNQLSKKIIKNIIDPTLFDPIDLNQNSATGFMGGTPQTFINNNLDDTFINQESHHKQGNLLTTDVSQLN